MLETIITSTNGESFTLLNALINYKKKQQYYKKLYGKKYLYYHIIWILKVY